MKLNYINTINSLKGIAIIAIVLFNSDISLKGMSILPGGFVGIDIFLVIIGFITTITILKEFNRNNNFSLIKFHIDCLKKIYPTLLIVFLFFLPFAWSYLLTDKFTDFSKSILYSTIFFSNFYFHLTGLFDGSAAVNFKPFHHTWVISLIFQFYIVFPIILLFSLKYFKRYTHLIILFLLLASFYATFLGINEYPNATYYFLTTRFWEFLSGSIVGIVFFQNKKKFNNKLFNTIILTLSICILSYIIFFINKIFLSSLTVLIFTILSTCLFIFFAPKKNYFGKIILSKYLSLVGLISVSLYLWHYPIFVFTRISGFAEGQLLKKIFVGLVFIIVAVISYRLIENSNKIFSAKKMVSSLIVVLVTNYLIVFNGGFINRFANKIYNIPAEPIYNLLGQNNKKCFGRINNFCNFNKKSVKKIYLIGDSSFASLMYDLNDRLIDKDFNFIPITFPGYFHFEDLVNIDLKSGKIDKSSMLLRDNINKIIKTSENNIFIFGGSASIYFNHKRFYNNGIFLSNHENIYLKENNKNFKTKILEKDFTGLIEKISKNNGVIIIYPIPEIGFSLPDKLKMTTALEEKLKVNKHLYQFKYDKYYKVNEEIISLYDRLNRKNLRKVYPQNLFCNTAFSNECIIHDDKNIFFSDKYHPSTKGAELINKLIIKKIYSLNSYLDNLN